MKLNKHLIPIILILAAILFITSCVKEPVCGNSIIEKGENSSTCCLDAGCFGEQRCVNSTCISPECDDCQYLNNETQTCIDYECCDSTECSILEECADHECKELSCDDCAYIDNHTCVDLACCDDLDCDDDNEDTIDLCKFPGTKSAECTNNECETDEDCDDHDVSTTNNCSIETYKCLYYLITDCIDDDGYCPEDYCDYTDDNDCEIEVIECDDDDIDCFYDELETCHLAEVTWTITDDHSNSSVEIDVTTDMTIEGVDDDGNCEVSFETDEIDLDFTTAYIDELKADPYNLTDQEVQNKENDAQDNADDVEDYDWTCYFEDTDDLIAIFEDWKDGYYDVEDDFADYDCSGDYFD